MITPVRDKRPWHELQREKANGNRLSRAPAPSGHRPPPIARLRVGGRRLVGLLSGSLLLVGCSHVALERGYSGPKPLPPEIKNRYDYPPSTGPVSERIIERSTHYTVRRISFPSSHNLLSLKNDITIDYYDIRPRGRAPVILVLPILGGSNGIAKTFAQHFAGNGYAAVLVHRQKEYKKLSNLHIINPTLEQIVIDHRQAIDWIATRPELDPERIGVFGVSMGGIKGALLSAIEQERIAASVIVLAGGDIPYILTYSNEDEIADRRKALLRTEQISSDELYRRLSSEITADPLFLAEYIDARKMLMILALFDKVVPYETGKALRREIGYPETAYILSGHYTAAFYTPYVKFKSVRFFDRLLGSHQKELPPETRQAQLEPAEQSVSEPLSKPSPSLVD